ncbi:PDZ domain-containing protein [Trebonia kvetii]|uniref:PDZ domain-containing protein n=1 Tax=Trebonia kvetii TaxID=2480626 RepID=A0A6P2C0S5_9ACTN|nr:trypsin-like peptidase domain-containing protein [Trebonia kvetii]TVZ03053.1 PDZ domain-containing protein [Trebonia kvetii]
MSEPFAQYPYGQYGPYPAPEPPRRHYGRTALGLTATAIVAAGVGAGAAIGLSNGSSGGSTATSTSKEVLSTSQIANRVDPAIVDVTSTLGYQEATAKGTGIVLTANGEILTNNHVINGATSISVTDIGNGKTYKATVVGYDESHDIAVLQLSGASGLTVASTGNSSTVGVGDSVVALGNAGGTGGTPAVAAGAVTALNQSITASDESSGSSEQLTGLLETNADIQAGDSGGPLVNEHGQVIGIDTAASSGYQFGGGGSGGGGFGGSGSSGSSGTGSATQGYAIPINTALDIAKQIEAGQASATVHIGATAFLGLEIASTQSGPYQGVTLAGTKSGTAAAEAGLGQGDVVTALDGKSVTSGTDITKILVGHHPGDKVKIAWTDTSGQSHTATLTLGTGPAA